MNVDESAKILYQLAIDKFKIELIDNNWHGFTKKLFHEIKKDRLRIHKLKRERDKLKEDYEDISKPYVRGECYGSDGGGTPINSWHTSYEENLHIERQEILEEISDLTIKQRIIEKHLKEEFDAFECICYEYIENMSISNALMMFYIDNMEEQDISIELGHTISTISNYIYQGIKKVSNLIKKVKI